MYLLSTNCRLFVNHCIPLTPFQLSLSLSLPSLCLLLLAFTQASLFRTVSRPGTPLSLQAVGTSFRRGSGSLYPGRFSLSSSPPLSPVCMLSCLPPCVGLSLLSMLMLLSSSMFMWPVLFPSLHGGVEMVQLRSYLFGQPLKLPNVLLDTYTVIFVVDLSCTLDIYFMSVCPRRGIPPYPYPYLSFSLSKSRV